MFFYILVVSILINVTLTCEKFGIDHVEQTCPYSNEQLETLIEGLPNYNDSDSCLINEKCAKNWMLRANEVIGKVYERASFLQFQYETNVTDYNNQLIIELAPLLTKLSNILFYNGKKFYNNSIHWNSELRRMLFLTRLVDLSESDVVELITNMTSIYATTSIEKNGKIYNLEPELEEILANSRDYNELLWAWNGWYDNVGPKMRDLYVKSIELQNKYARKYGYKDMSEHWIEELETENFENLYDQLYEKIKPFYEQLHAYVRRKLRDFYGDDKIKTKYIPAHLLGNMWAQSWDNIYDLVIPFKNVELYNLTTSLLDHKYTPLKIFKESEKFFTSLGLYPMTDTFWKYSMIEKPTDDREVVCHGAAFDFYNGFDYRIKMCTKVTGEYFYIAHHEMGHIEYFMSYSEQPMIFRNGANSGFHEAIGDTVALSVNNPTHLKKIGLLNSFNATLEYQINFLMKTALQKFAFLPFGYLLDKWRWDVFRNKITPENYNEKYWEMIMKYQGIEPPTPRNETFFDAGAKYHIPANVPYARYYVASFLQFQFYKSLCKLAGHHGPLNLCDFYNSKKAGLKFKDMLSLGASKHWTVPLKTLTGNDKLDATSILEYFKPLMDWLIKENKKYPNETVGW